MSKWENRYFDEIPDKHHIEKIVATLTQKEAVVYKALVCSWMINHNEWNEKKSDIDAVIVIRTSRNCALEESKKSIEISSRIFSGVVGSLAKKKLYQLMEWFGEGHLYKTVIINGQEEKVHPQWAYVFCTREFFESVVGKLEL